MVYTLVLRSENRTNSDDKTNKCRIRHGLDTAVADIDNWRVTVKQFIIPKQYNLVLDSTQFGYITPGSAPQGWYLRNLTSFINYPWIEVRVKFGNSCKSYDSLTKGGTHISHFQPITHTLAQTATSQVHAQISQEQGVTHAPISYDIGRIGGSEVEVELYNPDGGLLTLNHLGGSNPDNSYDPSDWILIMQLEPIE